jgi:hypothetical protein
MKLDHKHIILVLMVLIASAPFLLPGSLMVQRAIVIHEMNEKLESSALQVIKADEASIKWHKKGKECWIDNRLFDVKDYHTENGMTYLTGLFDDEEKDILFNMGAISAPLPQEKENSDLIFQITHLDIEQTDLPLQQAILFVEQQNPVLEIHFKHSHRPSIFLPPELI